MIHGFCFGILFTCLAGSCLAGPVLNNYLPGDSPPNQINNNSVSGKGIGALYTFSLFVFPNSTIIY